MNSLQSPIADFAVSFYIKRPEGILDEIQSREINKIIELIKSLSKTEGVESTIELMKADLFNLKISLVPFLLKEEDFLSNYLKNFAIEIANKRNTNTVLGKTISDVLILFNSLIEPFTDKVSPDLINGISLPDYNSLSVLSSYIRDKSLLKFIEFIDYALELDCALIIADLVLNKLMKISKKEEKNLISQLNYKGEEFAIIGIEQGLLTSKGSDLSQIHRNAKIRIAVKQLASNSGRAITTNDLQSILAH